MSSGSRFVERCVMVWLLMYFNIMYFCIDNHSYIFACAAYIRRDDKNDANTILGIDDFLNKEGSIPITHMRLTSTKSRITRQLNEVDQDIMKEGNKNLRNHELVDSIPSLARGTDEIDVNDTHNDQVCP